MKTCKFKSYDELPIFLNVELIAETLGIAVSSAYEIMHEKDFPVLKVGGRMLVEKQNFKNWINEKTGGKKWIEKKFIKDVPFVV